MIAVRALSEAEREAFGLARLVAVERAPYLAHALFAVRAVAADGLGTFAVDRSWRLYLDPATLAAWGPQVSGGVLIHEAGHLVRDHAGRAAALPGPVDHERWNYATDAAINDDLIRAGIALPDGVVTPSDLGLSDAGIEEGYYAQLGGSAAGSPQAGQGADGGQGGCGSGAGDPVQPWELPVEDAAAPGLDEGRVSIARRRTAQAVRDAAARGRGTVPAGLARWAQEELSAPSVPWRKVLAGAVRRTAALAAGRVTYSYSRPGRRRLPGIVTPAMRAPKVTAAVVVDTSGSMSPHDLAVALAEVSGVIKAVGGSVRVLTCDAQASTAREVRRGEDVRLVGGGGTDMRVGIEAAARLRPAPDVTVVLTDGDTPWPSERTASRLVCVLTRPGSQGQVPSWATSILVP